MTAAEKLKALDEGIGDNLLAQANYYFGPGARTAVSRESVATYQALAKYRRALPQIVAVIQEAERVTDDDALGDLRLVVALEELDKALS